MSRQNLSNVFVDKKKSLTSLLYSNDNDDGWWWIKGTVIDLFFLSSVCQGSYEW